MGKLHEPRKTILIACAIVSLVTVIPGMASADLRAPMSAAGDSVAGGASCPSAADRSWFSWFSGGAAPFAGAVSMEASWEAESELLEAFYGCPIDTIVISGNTRTKPITILREMATKQGTKLDEKLIRRDIAYLRGLGYFSEVAVSAEDTGAGRCRLIVAIAERPGLFMKAPYPVVNYDFEKGISYGFNWKIKNFRGSGEDLSISALARRDKEQGASFSWTDPWFADRRIRFRFDLLGYERLEEPEYGDFIENQYLTNLGIGVPLSKSLVRQLWFKTSLSFDMRRSRLTLTSPLDGTSSDFHRQNFISLGAEIEYDSRDNRMSPFNGMLHRLRVRKFEAVSGIDQQYIYYGSSDYFYLPIRPYQSLIIAVDADVHEGDTPSFVEMSLGGLRDLRGFSHDDVRGSAKVVCTIQYRSKLVGPVLFRLPRIGKFDFTMNGVLFLDNGMIAKSVLDWPESTIYTTGGLGIEIISPLRDIMRLEVATDATGTPAFYLTAGSDF